MEIRLEGLHAVVGGASQGIGLATAVTLAHLGASVTLLARNRMKLEQAVAGLDTAKGQQHQWIAIDLAETDALEAALADRLKGRPVDILVNNTGGPPPGLAHEAPLADYERGLRQHLLAFQTLVLALVPGMKERRHGRIINVLSTSVKVPLPNLGVSNTVRGAMAQWAKTLANELGPYNITVNNVLPGATRTDRITSLIAGKSAETGQPEDAVADGMKRAIPMHRFAEPEEVAAAICFLAGPSAAYINGINLPVDGGRTGAL